MAEQPSLDGNIVHFDKEVEFPTVIFKPVDPFASLNNGVAFKASIESVSGKLYYSARKKLREKAKLEEKPFFHFLSEPVLGEETNGEEKVVPLFSDDDDGITFGVEIKVLICFFRLFRKCPLLTPYLFSVVSSDIFF